MAYDGWGWKPYVPVAERRRKALREIEKRRKKGGNVSPVLIEGRVIARTFWGKSWCENLERYSDYANRLPRGRTYARNGSVVDLQIEPGAIRALVSGTELYEVSLQVAPVAKARWKSICEDCAGAIDSLVELLQGRFSKGVMERICRQNHGLFPSPAELTLSCSCPDWADMCKHVAAVLYGIGARFDHQPELLFLLRGVDKNELIVKAGTSMPLATQGAVGAKVLGGEDLAEIFGIDLGLDMGLDTAQSPSPAGGKAKKASAKRTNGSAAKTKTRAAPAGKREKPRPAASKRSKKANK
jgi:uncharacterized Zn finger protein